MSPEELFDKADAFEETGDQRAALQIWRDLAVTHPEPASLCRLGRLAWELGENAEAEEAFTKALTFDSDLGLAYEALGSMSLDRKDYEGAEEYLRKALSIEQTRSALNLLGIALRHLKRDDEAKKSYEQAIKLDPLFDEAYFNLGVLVAKADAAQAELLFNTALELDPNFASVHRELGWLQKQQGRMVQAEAHVRKAIELQPDDAWAHIYLGNILWHEGHVSAAKEEFKWAREATPQWATPLWALANIYEDQEEWDVAQRLYERALELEPYDQVANMNLGRMLVKKGEPQMAAVFLRRALLLNPDDVNAKRLLTEIESGSGQ